MVLILAVNSQLGWVRRSRALLEEGLCRPADDDARSAAAGVTLPPRGTHSFRPHDRGRRRPGERPGPGVKTVTVILIENRK